MSFLDWFRRRRNKEIDEEKEMLERRDKLHNEIERRVEKEAEKRKKRKESA